jgi:hypothetical protein
MITPMESLLVHLEMYSGRVDMVNVQSIIDTINESYLEQEKEHIMMAFNDGKVNAVLNKRNSQEYFNQSYNK